MCKVMVTIRIGPVIHFIALSIHFIISAQETAMNEPTNCQLSKVPSIDVLLYVVLVVISS